MIDLYTVGAYYCASIFYYLKNKNTMKFEFAKYTEITDFAFSVNPDYKKEDYVRFFICPDVWDCWFVRILKGFECTDEEGYIQNENSYILERKKVSMDTKGQKLTLAKLRQIIEEDDGDNWDIEQDEDIEELIEMIDGGFGIINRMQTF